MGPSKGILRLVGQQQAQATRRARLAHAHLSAAISVHVSHEGNAGAEMAFDVIAIHRGIDIDLKTLPLDDAPTLQMLSDGHTVGVFQLEGGGMTDHIKNLKPRSMVDVASMIALYRPGPMEQIGRFIEARHGRIIVRIAHPRLPREDQITAFHLAPSSSHSAR